MADTPAPVTIFGFDFGTGKIGIAVGQTVTRSANPLTVIRARDGQPDWNQVGALVNEWKPDLFVVGNPLNMDGTISEMSRRARKFANRLTGRFNVPAVLVDERLSSFDARQNAEVRSGRQPIDSEAARLILLTWFAEHL